MRLKRRTLAICVAAYVLAAMPLRALDPQTHLTQFGRSSWRLQDGVLDSAPLVITQSKDGYIWIGTETGLLRFDGVRFTPWKPHGSEQLFDPQVNALLAASDGTLWIGTPSLIASWKDNKLAIVSAHGYVNSLAEDHQGRIWAAVSRSREHQPLCQITVIAVKCHGAESGVPFSYGGGVDVDRDGNLIAASSDQIIRWNAESGLQSAFHFEALKQSENLHGISTFLQNPDGSLLVGIGFAGKQLGLQQLKDGSISPFLAAGLDGSTLEPQALYRDRTSSLWIGTSSSGLYRVVGNAVEHFTTREGLSGNSVRGFFEDREGNLWVATDGGVDCFHDLKVLSYTSQEGLPSGFVSSILAAHDGSVYVGSHSALHIIRNGTTTTIDSKHGLPGNGVTALAEDNAGHIWMGVGDDLAVYDGQRVKLFKTSEGQSLGVVAALATDTSGNVWASTIKTSRTIFRISGSHIETMATLTGSTRIGSDNHGGVWFTDSARLGHYTQGRILWTALPLKHNVLQSLMATSDGAVFVGNSEGVWGVRDGKIQSMNRKNGLPCDSVNGMAFSNTGSFYLRSSCGIIVIKPDALQSWWNNPTEQVAYQLIDSYDGARSSHATFSPQMSLAPDGRIWSANEGSVQVFDPDRTPQNSLSPPLHIEELVADRERFDPVEGMKLPPLTRDLEIHYTALSFGTPQKVRFRYRLDGRDTTWLDPGTRRTAFYQDLKPGHYRFRIIASNNDGVWNSTGDSLDFTVRPAWFQTVWFRVLWSTSLCLFIWFLYRLRVRYIAKALSARFDERLDERTRMALELHDTFLQTVQGSKMVADDALDASADQARMRQALENLSRWLEQAVAEGRAALHALRVSTTERNHLAQFLDRTAKEYCQHKSISVALTVIGDAKDLHPIVRDEITRIAEEAIRNAAWHSKASQFSIELRYARDLTLSLKDNGVGIDPEVIDEGKQGHFGIQGMKDRSARIRARITIRSTLEAGTEITLRVPGEVVYRKDSRPLLKKLWPSKPNRESEEE